MTLALAATLAGSGLSSPGSGGAPPRIVAVGDLHGDYDVWVAIARAAGVTDAAGHWAGGKTILVQDGDIVDREADSLLIIRNLMQLEREAPRAGGRVVVVLGNHEAMMMTGDLRYTHPGEIAAFADKQSARRRDQFYAANRTRIEAYFHKAEPSLAPAAIRQRWYQETPLGALEHRAAWLPDGLLGKWSLAHPAVARIGGTLFVHGGLSPAYAAVPIDEINRRVTAALAARETAPSSIINDPLGPLWYRGLAGRPPEGVSAAAAPLPIVSAQLDAVLAATRAKRIVIAHTPLLSGVQVSEGGRLVRIDAGNSRAYGGVPGYVEIVGDRVTTHNVARPPASTGPGK